MRIDNVAELCRWLASVAEDAAAPAPETARQPT